MIFTPLATDNFNRADSNDLGADWDEGYTDYFGLEIASNMAQAEFDDEGDVCLETYNALSLPNNQYGQFVVKQWGGESLVGLLLRANTPGVPSGYLFNASSFTGGSANTIEIAKIISDVWTTLSDDTVSWAVDNVLKGAVLDGDLYLFKDDVEVLSAADSDLSAGRAGLVALYFTHTDNIPRLEDLVLGEVEEDGDPPAEGGHYLGIFSRGIAQGIARGLR